MVDLAATATLGAAASAGIQCGLTEPYCSLAAIRSKSRNREGVMRRTIAFVSVIIAAAPVGEAVAQTAFQCDPEEIVSRTIPRTHAWRAAPRSEGPQPRVTRSWLTKALGLEWRAMDTEGFAVTEYPAPIGYQTAFFASRRDSGYCGSGGCAISLYTCGEDGCEEPWVGFDGPISYPGSTSNGYADFIVDGSNLWSFERGRFRSVCNVSYE